MPINFPIPSFVGELYTFGQTTWEWSGEYWGVYSAQTGYVYSVTTSTGLSGDTTQGNITLLNTAPDQLVTISGGTGILTGGTYPNFTITNSSPDQTVTISNGQYISITGTYPNFTISTTGITDNDKFITGFTYNNNTFTLTDNSGNTLNATINDVTGLTINGDLTVTGSSFLNTITANTITNVDYIDFDITQTGTTSSPGRLFWDVNNRTLSLGMLSGVTQQIGEEQYYLVENQTSGTLLDGYVVRAAGTTGSSGKILIDYMIANGTIPAFTTMGVLTQTLLSGETGYVTSFGLVRNIDTTGAPYGETWNQGDVLYVSTTILGGFTKFRPIVPNQDIIIAIVMDAAVNGSIFVRPDVYRPFKDPQLITVAKQNADFTSIKDAVDSIVGSSISNRYVIDVGPGIFVEDEIDLTSTPYVSIVGSNIQTTLVVPSGSTQHVFKIGINNEISFLSISGVSTGYAGIYCYDIGDFGQAHKISMYDCDTNLWVESDTQDTKFYGEYMDFNGTYTYGTRVVGNNGFLALANMENYFNFPTGSNITYCNHATGSGATINAFVCDNVSNGVSGTTAFLIQDGSQLNTSTVTCDGNTYGVRNPNIGSPVRFDIDNASFVDGEWDLCVESIGTFGTLGGSSNHQKIFTASENVYWAFLDIDDGEFDITRKASVTFTDGSHTDFTTLIFEGGTMGLISGGSITTISGFTVQADAGFGYLEKSDDSGIVRRIDWVNNQITLSANTDNYIYINENSNLVSSGTKPITSYNILLGRVITDSTGVEFIDLSPMNAQHTSNSFDSLFTMALGPIFATGSIVTEGITPFTLDVSQGDYHFSTNEFLPVGGTGITFTQYYRNGTGSTWVTSATTLVNNTQYDNNGTLTGLTSGYFTKHTLYTIGQGSYENYFLVLGQNEYSTLVEAEDALLPTPPTYFSDGVVQIANIYIEQGSSGITQVEDIRPTIGFRAGGVNASSVHGNLLGLAADDHIQYLLVSGARAMSGNLDMGVNNITNVGTVDGVTVSSHAARHQFGGLDPVGSVTPSANAIPYADVSGTLNDWVSTASTTTFGKVKTSSSSTTVVSDNDSSFLNSFTGGTYSGGTISFTNNSGGTYNVTGLTSVNGSSPQVGFFSSNTNLTGSNNLVYSGGTLQVRPTGSSSSDVAFRIQNSGGTENGFQYNGDGTYRLGGLGGDIYTKAFSHISDGRIFMSQTGNNFIELNPGTSQHRFYFPSNGVEINTDTTLSQMQMSNSTAMYWYRGNVQLGSLPVATNTIRGYWTQNGTPPTASDDYSDRHWYYSADIVAGNAVPHFRTEAGNIVKLYTHSAVTTTQGIANALTTLGLLSASTIASSTDVFVTGGTYSSGTATFTNNTGGTFNLTGLTSVNGSSPQVGFFSSNTNLTGSNNFVYSGGTLQVRATGSSSSDVAFRVRNSADTYNMSDVQGDSIFNFRVNNTATASSTGLNLLGTNTNVIVNASSTNTSGSNRTGFLATGGGGYVGLFTDYGGSLGAAYAGVLQFQTNSTDRMNFVNASNNCSGWAFLQTSSPTYVLGNTVFAIYPTNNQAGGGTLALGTTLGTTISSYPAATYGKNTFFIANGTAPTTTGADAFGIYSADIVAGNAAPHFRTENGDIVKLYTHSAVTTTQGIANALTTLGLLSASTITSATDVFVTGGTYSNGSATFTNNTGGTFNVTGFFTGGTSGVSGDYLPLSGGTVTGATNFTAGLTANTISATTYVNYPTQDLSTTLGYGNSSGINDISMGTTTSIISDNGGGQIDLDSGGNAGSIKITTDSGTGVESFIKMTSIDSEFGYSNSSFGIATSYTKINAANRFYIDNLFNSSPSQEVILIDDNGGGTDITTFAGDKPGVIIGSDSSTIVAGIRNVVIAGGTSITATSSNTLYSYGFNIFNTPANNNSNTQILSRNTSTGNIEYTSLSYITGLTSGDTFVTGGTYNNTTGTATFTNNTGGTFNVTGFSTGGTGSDTYVTGLTYSANVLTLSQNQGQPNLTATIGLKIKSDTVAAGSFTGNPKKYTVTFTTAYPNTSYTISITGSDNRTFTYESKATTGFVINTNANTALTGNVDWQTIAIGES